ncbi:MAG TPA: hypothetical protein VME68_06240, partial [Acidobacteriaceae bacterium]|nr:hypothetical protein [Acidobacteriaceae bacterium]
MSRIAGQLISREKAKAAPGGEAFFSFSTLSSEYQAERLTTPNFFGHFGGEALYFQQSLLRFGG